MSATSCDRCQRLEGEAETLRAQLAEAQAAHDETCRGRMIADRLHCEQVSQLQDALTKLKNQKAAGHVSLSASTVPLSPLPQVHFHYDPEDGGAHIATLAGDPRWHLSGHGATPGKALTMLAAVFCAAELGELPEMATKTAAPSIPDDMAVKLSPPPFTAEEFDSLQDQAKRASIHRACLVETDQFRRLVAAALSAQTLRAELAALQVDNGMLRQLREANILGTQDQIAWLQGEVTRLREALQHLEWCAFDGHCPICGAEEPTHMPACQLQMALGQGVQP